MPGVNWSKKRLGWRYWPTVYYYEAGRSLRALVPFVVAFVAGLVNEACSVVWVHQATHGTALSTALVSGVQALAIVLGVGESVKNWHAAPFYVIGYASGAYGAMVLG